MATRGYENFTATDAARHALKHAPQPKRGKYGSVKTTVDNITFDSKREAARYVELKLMEKAGQIASLELQPVFPTRINGVRICDYVADFRYECGTRIVVEDVKGMKTPIYRLKKKLVEALYRITISEIR